MEMTDREIPNTGGSMKSTVDREVIIKFAEELGFDPTAVIEAVVTRDHVTVLRYHKIDGVIQNTGTNPILVRDKIDITTPEKS